jgi:hypothetical protein
MYLKLFYLIFISFFTINKAHAYIGPGLGLGVLGVMGFLIIFFILGIFFLVYYSIKIFFKKKKKKVDDSNK